MKRTFASALLITTALFLSAQVANAAEPVALRVIVVQPTDLKAYVHELGNAQGLIKKAGVSAIVRIWQAQFAGSDAGTVIVSLEFANMAALAHYYEAARSNADLAAELAKLATMRKIVSDSLYTELGF